MKNQVRWKERFIVAAFLLGLTIWAVVDVRKRAMIDPQHPHLHMTDLTVFTGAGEAFFNPVEDPYEYQNIRGWMYAYPPLFAILLSPLSYLQTHDQAIVWFAICVLLSWLAWRECLLLAQFVGEDISLTDLNETPTRAIGWLAVATVGLPTLDCLQRGQVGVVLIYFLLLGVRLILTSQQPWIKFIGGMFLVLPGVFKLLPFLPMCLFLFQLGVFAFVSKQNRLKSAFRLTVTGVAIGLFVFVFLFPSVCIGWEANLAHLNTWCARMVPMMNSAEKGQLDNPLAMRNQSLTNGVFRCGNYVAHQVGWSQKDTVVDFNRGGEPPQLPMSHPIAKIAVLVAKALIVASLLLLAICTSAQKDYLGTLAVFGLSNLAALCISPVSWGHYFMMLLPAVLFVPLWFNKKLMSWTGTLSVAILPAMLVIAHYLFLPYAGRIGLLGIGVTVWYTVAVVFMLRHYLRTESVFSSGREELWNHVPDSLVSSS